MLRKTSAQRAAPLTLTIRPLDPFSEASGVGWRMRTTPANERKIKIHILFLLLDTEHDDTHRFPTHTHTHTQMKRAETAPANSFTEISLLWQQVSHQQQLTFGPWNWAKKHSNGRHVDDVQSADRGIQVTYLWFYRFVLWGGFRCRNFCIKTLHNHFRHSVSCCRFISVQHRPLVRSAGTEGEPHRLHNSYKYTVYL